MCIVARLYLVCYILCLIILLFVAFCQSSSLSFHTIVFSQILACCLLEKYVERFCTAFKRRFFPLFCILSYLPLHFYNNFIFLWDRLRFISLIYRRPPAKLSCRFTWTAFLHIFSFFYKNLLLYFSFSAKITS